VGTADIRGKKSNLAGGAGYACMGNGQGRLDIAKRT
jgi:hypothetical protein